MQNDVRPGAETAELAALRGGSNLLSLVITEGFVGRALLASASSGSLDCMRVAFAHNPDENDQAAALEVAL
jgi:hypothetical protein